ncbi:MAG: hypothetical protein Ta2D_00190 [Rickettsiales bacterium]|nr:MAG: hypothetical protein Ta2D_00190 [Rickettsiales bacterium]
MTDKTKIDDFYANCPRPEELDLLLEKYDPNTTEHGKQLLLFAQGMRIIIKGDPENGVLGIPYLQKDELAKFEQLVGENGKYNDAYNKILAGKEIPIRSGFLGHISHLAVNLARNNRYTQEQANNNDIVDYFNYKGPIQTDSFTPQSVIAIRSQFKVNSKEWLACDFLAANEIKNNAAFTFAVSHNYSESDIKNPNLFDPKVVEKMRKDMIHYSQNPELPSKFQSVRSEGSKLPTLNPTIRQQRPTPAKETQRRSNLAPLNPQEQSTRQQTQRAPTKAELEKTIKNYFKDPDNKTYVFNANYTDSTKPTNINIDDDVRIEIKRDKNGGFIFGGQYHRTEKRNNGSLFHYQHANLDSVFKENFPNITKINQVPIAINKSQVGRNTNLTPELQKLQNQLSLLSNSSEGWITHRFSVDLVSRPNTKMGINFFNIDGKKQVVVSVYNDENAEVLQKFNCKDLSTLFNMKEFVGMKNVRDNETMEYDFELQKQEQTAQEQRAQEQRAREQTAREQTTQQERQNQQVIKPIIPQVNALDDKSKLKYIEDVIRNRGKVEIVAKLSKVKNQNVKIKFEPYKDPATVLSAINGHIPEFSSIEIEYYDAKENETKKPFSAAFFNIKSKESLENSYQNGIIRHALGDISNIEVKSISSIKPQDLPQIKPANQQGIQSRR